MSSTHDTLPRLPDRGWLSIKCGVASGVRMLGGGEIGFMPNPLDPTLALLRFKFFSPLQAHRFALSLGLEV